jgi:hypothetical protein
MSEFQSATRDFALNRRTRPRMIMIHAMMILASRAGGGLARWAHLGTVTEADGYRHRHGWTASARLRLPGRGLPLSFRRLPTPDSAQAQGRYGGQTNTDNTSFSRNCTPGPKRCTGRWHAYRRWARPEMTPRILS